MDIKVSDQVHYYRLQVSLAGELSLDTKQDHVEDCIEDLLREVLLIIKDHPERVDTLLEDL